MMFVFIKSIWYSTPRLDLFVKHQQNRKAFFLLFIIKIFFCVFEQKEIKLAINF